MAGHDDSRNDEIEQLNSNLDQGLKSCRSVMRSYRELLVGDAPAPPAPDNDDQAEPPAQPK